ncbi:unnamed protein product [Microthlaspi erraticum]|uniref:Translation initiation factor beta propellor-like domain-containing protein n=1 Tax=Microthlaspi erraticum TaxID=1685480 RepID=A0A6D2HKC6_9BRAS|nr:unnamed protein product [Microthlaspi erraticum]
MTVPSDDFRFMTPQEIQSLKDTTFHNFQRKRNPLDTPFDPVERTDETTLDQLIIRCLHIVEVLNVDRTCVVPKRVLNFHWNFRNGQWSPLGTYLATIEPDGVVIWDISDTCRKRRLMSYRHSSVDQVDFSPGEKYLVTYKRPEPSNPSELVLKIFEVQTGEFLMGGGGGSAGVSWPLIRWAGGKDDKYFATFSKNTVSVYDTDCFSSLDFRPVIIFDDHVVEMSWSPTDSILALIKGDGKKQSSKVVLVEIPSKVELRHKNLFSVEECKLYWQSNGEYLAVKVDIGFKLLRIKDGGGDVLNEKKMHAFAWEPNGDRFAVIHGDHPPDVSFYSMKGGKLSKLISLTASEVDALFWSPRGKYIVLSGLKSFNGKLTFFNLDTLQIMATDIHVKATNVAWNATGNFVTTALITDTIDYDELKTPENGFKMWAFDGERLHWLQRDSHLLQLDWRPYGGNIDELIENPLREEIPMDKSFDPELWRTDETALFQLVIRCGYVAEILQNEGTDVVVPEDVFKLSWNDMNVKWSPLGTYIATLTKHGVVAWGGADTTFNRLMYFMHSMVEEVDFSPGEKYLVTYRRSGPSNPSEVDFKLFEVTSGRLLLKGRGDDASGPVIGWGGGKDDKYFFMLSKKTVSVYDTASLTNVSETDSLCLSDMKPILNVDHVVGMSWSPTDSILAMIKGDGKQQSPKVALVVIIPNDVKLRHKTIFSVTECKMYWQGDGEYLAIKVDSGFELFRIKDGGDTPMDLLKVDNMLDFAWEPNGDRFAVIHGDQPKPDVSIYSMKTAENLGKVSKLITLEAKEADALFWSPRGMHIVLAGLKRFSGSLEFFSVDAMETLGTAIHLKATDVAWDPTGRYVSTAFIAQDMEEEPEEEHEKGFKMWNFKGEFLYWSHRDHCLLQLEWRPYGGSIDEALKHPEKTSLSRVWTRAIKA